MKKVIFGKSGITSLVGYMLAGLMVLDESLKAGETSWTKIAIAVAIAVLGRVSGDANKIK